MGSALGLHSASSFPVGEPQVAKRGDASFSSESLLERGGETETRDWLYQHTNPANEQGSKAERRSLPLIG